MTKAEREKEANMLQLQIQLNEMLPAQMRCKSGIARMKHELKQLTKPAPALRVIEATTTNEEAAN